MKTAEDLISVVIPVYNVSDYLKECLDSVLAQKYPSLEVIMIDDGSTDNSGEICDEYVKKHHNFRVIHQENGGLSAARNKGISVAKGEYICFIDSDDYILPGYISQLYKTAQEHKADICVCGYGDIIPPELTLIGSEATVRLLTQQENMDNLAWNKLYKRHLFIDYDIRYPEGKINEDNLTTYKLYSHANKVSYLPKSLYFYRERENSITKKSNYLKQLQMRELAAKEARQYVRAHETMRQAADIAILTAKFAYMDKAIAGKIEMHYFEEAKKWVLDHREEYRNNIFMGKKLKLYYALLSKQNGKPYIAFRKVKHE